MQPELSTPLHKKMVRLLSSSWYTREELSDAMFMSEHQVTCLTTRLRNKGITIITRPSRRKPGYTEYSIGKKGDPLGDSFKSRSVKSMKDMLIIEMNRVRIEAQKLGIVTIVDMAVRALQASGIDIDST